MTLPEAGFDLFHFVGEVFVGAEHFAQFDEGPNDDDIHLHGAFAFEDG